MEPVEPAEAAHREVDEGLDRGIVGAIEQVRTLLVDSASRGVGVLLISEDLDEILDLADRIAVLYEGEVVGVVDGRDADVTDLGLLMGGGGRS